MELKDWVTSSITLLVAILSMVVGASTARFKAGHEEKKSRANAFRKYERAMFDAAVRAEIDGVGLPEEHFANDSQELKQARDEFFVYTDEFKGHEKYFHLRSPFLGNWGYPDPSAVVNFYSELEELLQSHLTKYPNPQKKSPYSKSTEPK